jgi:cytoskeletal protein RodZ
MAKRTPETEAPEAEPVPEVPPTVGERLRAAREKMGLSLEDVAAQTRIPQRHLASIETAEWDSLPAPTYTIGFAKNYAGVVGLDRAEVSDQLREEMGGQRFATTSADVFEPADPRRTMPKPLVIGAVIAAVLLIILMSVLNRRSLDQNEPAPTQTENSAAPAAPAPAPAAVPPAATPAAAQGPVVLTATAPAWIQVTDQGKTLFQAELQPGQTYTVPATVTAPMLKAGKPEALKINVGAAVAPQVGPAGKVTTVSLLPADLLKGPAAPQSTSVAVAPKPASAPPAKSRPRSRSAVPAPAPAPATQPPAAGVVTNGQ